MKVLVAGYFSFLRATATAGDLLACEVICGWLNSAGVPYDAALAPPNGDFDWAAVDPAGYSHLVFVCGPFSHRNSHPALARFGHCRKIGVNLSMLDEGRFFDVLFARDNLPDITFVSRPQRVPLFALTLVHPQSEYGARSRTEEANRALRQLARSRDAVTVEVDTRLDGCNAQGLRTPAQVLTVISKADVVLTTRLHGLVLALHQGVPVVAVDSVSGGAKVTRQAEVLGWPVFSVDRLDPAALAAALTECLTPAAKTRATACAAQAARKLHGLRDQFLASFG